MNTFTNNKITKKFILVLVLLILFNFCCPKTVNADGLGLDDFQALPLKIFYAIYTGIYKYLNDAFTENGKKFKYYTVDVNYNAKAIGAYLIPENIIKGKFLIFDADIFKDVSNVHTQDPDKYFDDGDSNIVSGRVSLRNTIAGWYYALRNFAIVALLSVLVYVGIRMIISTIAQDKAKYKVMFKDWLVALCLVIIMHYMMIGVLDITTLITDAIGRDGENARTIEDFTERISGILSESHNNGEDYIYKDWDQVEYTIEDGYGYMIVLYGVLIYTIIFVIKYLKREFTIIFLILLGPVSCITYPIDKISDGKAQAFNKWLTEFIYQAIIQPFHLVLYVVLIGTASNLADENVIYALVCLAVLIPAEKFVKEMFGFKDKLGSPIADMAKMNLARDAMKKLTSGGKSGSVEKGRGDENNNFSNELPPQTVEDKGDLVDGKNEESSDNQQSVEAEHDKPALDAEEDAGVDAGVETDNNIIENVSENIGDAATDIATAEAIDQMQNNQTGTTTAEERISDAQGQKETMRQIGDMIVQNNENSEKENQPNKGKGNSKENKKQGKLSKIATRAMAAHNKRVSAKYGTTSRGKRWVKRAGRGTRALAKGALKTAKYGAIATLGAAAVTSALVTGNGNEAMALAAGVGGYFGKEAINGGKKAIKGVTGAVKSGYDDYIRSDESKEKKAFNEYDGDLKKQQRARLGYMENHNGEEPGYEELRQEMQDRFILSRRGLSDDEIDRALPIYQEKRDELLANGMDKEKATQIAGVQAKQTAAFSKYWKESDYLNEATMSKAQDRIAAQLKSTAKCSDEVAQDYARKYITNAARMKGIDSHAVALPPIKKKISIPNRNNFHGRWNFEANQEEQNVQIQRFAELQLELIEEGGYTQEDVEVLVRSCSGKTNVELVDSFETKVKYLTDSSVDKAAKIHVERVEEGKGLSDVQITQKVKEEKIQRLGVRDAMGVKGVNADTKMEQKIEAAVSRVREMEEKQGTTEFREIGGKAIRGELSKNARDNMTDRELDMSKKYASLVKAETTERNPNTKRGKNNK